MTMQIDKNDSNASQKKAGILQTSSVSKELQPLQPLTPTPANGGTYKARRYALKLDPPCICMEYGDLEGKSRVRAVRISKITPDMDVDRLTRKVIRSFPRKLDMTSVKYDQVRKLVSNLIHQYQLQAQSSLQPDGVPSPTEVESPKAPASEGAARVRAEGLSTVRQSTESRFSSSSVENDTDNDMDAALRDLERELGGSGSTDGSGQGPSNLRGSTVSLDALSREASFCIADRPLSSNTTGSSASRLTTTSSSPALAQLGDRDREQPAKSRFAQEADRLVLEFDVSEDTDLNKVSDIELKMAKQKMDEEFNKNRVKPGDPDYVYDKQVEFGPATEGNDWDESDED